AALAAAVDTVAARGPAEQAPEDVAEVEIGEIERRAGGTGAERAGSAVVLLALLRVRQDVVGVLDLLESLLGLGVARVLVRVVLPHELAVGLLQVVLRHVLRDAERLVERARHSPPRRLRSRPPLPA